MIKYSVIAFQNTHTAIAAQKVLEGKVAFTVMPTPRSITAACGISLRLSEQESETALSMLTESSLADNMYKLHHIT